MIYPEPGDKYIDGRAVHNAVYELEKECEAYGEDVEAAEEALEEVEEEWEGLEAERAEADNDLAKAKAEDDEESIEAAEARIQQIQEGFLKYRKQREEAEKALEEARQALADWREEYSPVLVMLQELASEVSRDENLIHENQFTEYAQDLVEDIGVKIPDYVVVDWEATAKNIQQDYTAVEFGGETYYFRS